MSREFPALAVNTGSYPAEWSVGDRQLAGSCTLDPDRPPFAEVYGEFEDEAPPARGFPQEWGAPAFSGTLRSGLSLLLVDCHFSMWFPGRTRVTARYALVGLDPPSLDQPYTSTRLQIEGAERFFGVAPLSRLMWPRKDPWSGSRVTGDLNPESSMSWSHGSLEFRCGYDVAIPADEYRFDVRFAPMFDLSSAEPMAVGSWLQNWITPLRNVVSFATRQPRSICWVTFSSTVDDEHAPEGTRQAKAQLFGTGITQEPYVAERPDDMHDPSQRPLFALKTMESSLPQVVETWRRLERSDNPFVELYRLAMFQTDLPRRARFLYLVQALEALHTWENAVDEKTTRTRYRSRRSRILTELDVSGSLGESDIGFLKEKWLSRPPSDLADRVRELLDGPGDSVDSIVAEVLSTPLAAEKQADGQTEPATIIRSIRNDLSHGTRSYTANELRPWVRLLDALAEQHMLRLLTP